MKLYVSSSFDPFYNLAIEEFFFSKFKENIFVLYINSPSVIVGKHQIPFKEVNYEYINKNNIALCRRFSGGGTVYHDKGNLNFSFIRTNNKQGLDVDFNKYLEPLYDFLTTLRLRVTIDSRNNILLNKRKISGNAQHVNKKRTLHHGTLLFDVDLKNMKKALKTDQSNYSDKSVKSTPAKVCNLKDKLPMRMNIKLFRSYMIDFFVKKFEAKLFDLSEKQKFEIYELSLSKYSNPEWVYDYSPNYTFKNKLTDKQGETKFSFDVSRGVINSFLTEGVHQKLIENILRLAKGKKHRPEVFAELLKITNSENSISFVKAGIKESLFF